VTTGSSTTGRSMPAVLVAVLAVLASLLVGPAATATHPGAGASTVAVRGPAPLGTGQREAREQLRPAPRRGTRGDLGSAASLDRPATRGHVPSPSAAVAVVALLAVLVAGGLAVRGRTGLPSRRTPGMVRDRAPPALALA
jgi:hypothetical protein